MLQDSVKHFMQVRGYLPVDPHAAPPPQLLAANQALELQELALRKQELLFELQGYQVNRVAGTARNFADISHAKTFALLTTCIMSTLRHCGRVLFFSNPISRKSAVA